MTLFQGLVQTLVTDTIQASDLSSSGVALLAEANTFTVGPQTISVNDSSAYQLKIKNSATTGFAAAGYILDNGTADTAIIALANVNKPAYGAYIASSTVLYSSHVAGIAIMADVGGTVRIAGGSSATTVTIGLGNVTISQLNQSNIPGLTIDNAGPGTTGFVYSLAAGGYYSIDNAFSQAFRFLTVNRAMWFLANNNAYDSSPQAFLFEQNTPVTRIVVGIRGMVGQTAPVLQLQGYSSTGAAREQANVDTAWNANDGVAGTDATRSADLILSVYTVATAQEAIRASAAAAGVRLGFYGVTPTARQLFATGAGHTVDQLITVLQNLGLIRQS